MTLADKSNEMMISDWIEERALTHSDAPALLDTKSAAHLNFAELAEQTKTLSQRFRKLGIGRDSRVAVSLTDGPETLMILLSLMSIAAVLPVSPVAALAPFDELVERLGVSVVIGGKRPSSAAYKIAKTRDLCYIEVESNPSQFANVQLTPHRALKSPSPEKAGLDDVALYITTSGTTGKASVVAITQRSLDRNIATHGMLNGYGPGTRAMCVMGFNYIFAYVRASLPMLRFGGAVAIGPGYRFNDVRRCCETHKLTSMAATPTIIQKFIADAEGNRWRPEPGALQRFHATGEAIPHTLRTRLSEAFGASLGTNYGMTEVSPQVAIYQPEDQFGPGAAGKIVSPWQVDIVGDEGAVLPAGNIGRITLREGYINAIVGMEKETRFDNAGRFLTGDRGYIGDGGVLYIAGRVDDVINRGGEKIDPNTIERSLERDSDVVKAVVFGVPDPKFGQKIIGLIVPRKGAIRGSAEILEAAGALITGWGLPERLIVVSEIPTNANGKISRRDLAGECPVFCV